MLQWKKSDDVTAVTATATALSEESPAAGTAEATAQEKITTEKPKTTPHEPLPVHWKQSAKEQLLVAGEEFLSRYNHPDAAEDKIAEKKIQSWMAEIERALCEFHSNMFFVVIFGPLKAGKSTMVNALAHRYVSPTRLGRECTLRPSIVIQDNENGIDEYFMRDRSLDRNQVFQLAVDYVRRMKEWEDIEPYVYRVTSILNEENIETKLSRTTDEEPLITVIRVPGGRFVDGNTAIIDMPGLDGNISNLETSPIHHWVLERTDFLVFIQSSISAISKTTNHFLERLLLESKNPPIWLVQNIIDGKYWRSPQEREAEALQQLAETRDEIMRELDLKELYCTPINLGMALDGVMNDNEDLLRESKFQDFEERLYTILQDKRVRIQERNGLNGLMRSLKEARKEIQHTLKEIDAAQQEMGRIRLQFQQMENLISSHELYNNAHPRKNLEMQLMNLVTSEEEGLGRLLKDRVDKAILYCSREITGEELASNVMDLGESVREKGNQLYLKTDGEFGIRIAQQVNGYIQRSEHFMDESLTEYQTRLDELGAHIDLHFQWIAPEELPPFDYAHLSPVLEKAFRLGKNMPPVKKMLVFDRHFNGQQARFYIEGAAESIREQLKEQVEKWIGSLMDLHINEVCKQRRQARLSMIAENQQHFSIKMQGFAEKAERGRQMLEAMLLDAEQLLELCQAALQSVGRVE